MTTLRTRKGTQQPSLIKRLHSSQEFGKGRQKLDCKTGTTETFGVVTVEMAVKRSIPACNTFMSEILLQTGKPIIPPFYNPPWNLELIYHGNTFVGRL